MPDQNWNGMCIKLRVDKSIEVSQATERTCTKEVRNHIIDNLSRTLRVQVDGVQVLLDRHVCDQTIGRGDNNET